MCDIGGGGSKMVKNRVTFYVLRPLIGNTDLLNKKSLEFGQKNSK